MSGLNPNDADFESRRDVLFLRTLRLATIQRFEHIIFGSIWGTIKEFSEAPKLFQERSYWHYLVINKQLQNLAILDAGFLLKRCGQCRN